MVHAALLDQELKDVLQAWSETLTTHREVKAGQVVRPVDATVAMRVRQEVREGPALGMDLPMSRRSAAHVRPIVETDERRAVQDRVEHQVGPHCLQKSARSIKIEVQGHPEIGQMVAVDKHGKSPLGHRVTVRSDYVSLPVGGLSRHDPSPAGKHPIDTRLDLASESGRVVCQ